MDTLADLINIPVTPLPAPEAALDDDINQMCPVCLIPGDTGECPVVQPNRVESTCANFS